MRLIFTFIISAIFNHQTIAQTQTEIQWLDGYFIVETDTKILNGCSLDIESPESYLKRCGDFSFYKNISSIRYVSAVKINLDSIDTFSYQVKLQKDEMLVFLSTNSNIVENPAFVQKNRIEELFRKNVSTADSIQSQIEKLNLDFSAHSGYLVLMKVRIKAISISNRLSDPGDPLNKQQYALLFDPMNKVEVIRLIKSPFY